MTRAEKAAKKAALAARVDAVLARERAGLTAIYTRLGRAEPLDAILQRRMPTHLTRRQLAETDAEAATRFRIMGEIMGLSPAHVGGSKCHLSSLTI